MKTANSYTGHGANGSPIQKHSCADFYAQYGIIMLYAPIKKMHIAMIGDQTMAFGKNYHQVQGAAIIKAIAAPAMGGIKTVAVVHECPVHRNPVYGVVQIGLYHYAIDASTGAKGNRRMTAGEASMDVVSLKLRDMMHS